MHLHVLKCIFPGVSFAAPSATTAEEALGKADARENEAENDCIQDGRDVDLSDE